MLICDDDTLKHPVCCSCMFRSMHFYVKCLQYLSKATTSILGRISCKLTWAASIQSSYPHLNTETSLSGEAKSLKHECCVMHDDCGEPEKQIAREYRYLFGTRKLIGVF